jgi:hypothetical protein
MSELVLDDAVAAVLSATRGEVLLRDRSGKVIGKFRRTMSPEEMAARNPFTQEDLKEAERIESLKRPGVPLSEILARLPGQEAK